MQRNSNDYQLISREKDRLQDLVNELEKENIRLQQELKIQYSRYSDIELVRDKVNLFLFVYTYSCFFLSLL